jgi:hypothetical protein
VERLFLSCLFLSSCCAAGFNYRTQVGVVIARSHDLCMQIEDSSLRPDTRVDLVLMGVRQSVLRAEIQRKRDKPCSDMDAGDSYRLRRLDGEAGISIDAIAIVGFGGTLEVRAGVAAADLDGDGQKEFFRSCASHEGVHFTVWSGTPLKGQRRFHAYHYVGYDLEPNCTDSECDEVPG